jgi:hypothetical protein
LLAFASLQLKTVNNSFLIKDFWLNRKLKTQSMRISIPYQIKNLLVIVYCFVFMTEVKSQTFNISPANTQTVTFNCDSSMQANKIYISNPTSKDLDLSYSIVSNTLPSGDCWQYQFCDWEKCRINLPSGTNTPAAKIAANTRVSSMILDIVTLTNKGGGSFVLKLFETSNPSNSQTVTWNVIGCASGKGCTATGIPESFTDADFMVYPNPTEGFVNVNITRGYTESGYIQVFNVVGEKLIELNGMKSSIEEIDLQKLPVGAYLIKYGSKEGTAVKKIFKTK